MNWDETPICFNYTDGRTYHFKGDKTITAKTAQSGDDKRQATLILYIFADGRGYLKPKIIFHGTPTEEGGLIFNREGHLYHEGVTTEFNEHAYNTGDLTEKWINTEFIQGCQPSKFNPFLMVMDCAGFHKTDAVLDRLEELGVDVAMVPPGATGYLQPLDTHINKTFKALMVNLIDDYIDKWEVLYEQPEESWDLSKKRIMTTYVVGGAWRQLCTEPHHINIVRKSFIDLGINLPVDGRLDHLIRIKDFRGIEIGDYNLRGPEIEGYQNRILTTADDADEFEIAEEGAISRNYEIMTKKDAPKAVRMAWY